MQKTINSLYLELYCGYKVPIIKMEIQMDTC